MLKLLGGSIVSFLAFSSDGSRTSVRIVFALVGFSRIDRINLAHFFFNGTWHDLPITGSVLGGNEVAAVIDTILLPVFGISVQKLSASFRHTAL